MRLSVVCNARTVAKSYVVGVGSGTVGYRAMRSSYRLSMSICSGLAAILNAKLLPAAIIHVCRIAVSYPSTDCNVRYSSIYMSCHHIVCSLYIL